MGSRSMYGLTWSGTELPSLRRGDLAEVEFSLGSGMIMVGMKRCLREGNSVL
jgi:hypothetical protein